MTFSKTRNCKTKVGQLGNLVKLTVANRKYVFIVLAKTCSY